MVEPLENIYLLQADIDLEEKITKFALKFLENEEVSVFIDVSSLSRKIISTITSIFTFKLKFSKVKLTYCYTLAKFKKPNNTKFVNTEINPVHNSFSGWPENQLNPTSLIIGLGYEKNQADGAAEYFDSSIIWKFIPTSTETQYLSEIQANNEYLFDNNFSESKNNIFYDLHDMSQTFGQLEILTTRLIECSNPVFLPFGPRIFFALCLVIAIIHPECGVWCISENRTNYEFNEEPTKHLFGFSATFSSV